MRLTNHFVGRADRSDDMVHIRQWELSEVGRLSNSKLRKKGLRGCRTGNVTGHASEAWGFIDIARRSGDRRMVDRIRRVMGV